MKTVRFFTMTRLLLLFILSAILPVASHSSAISNLLSWSGWGSPFKSSETSGTISRMSFMEGSPPLHLVYDAKKSDEKSKIAELEKNQLYIDLDSKSGDTFHFCFRTANALSTKHYPSPPMIIRTSTGQSLPDIQAGEVRQTELTADPGHWQYEHLAKWRLPTGKASLVLSVQDNDNEWSIEPECSGIVSESTGLPSSSDGDKKRSSVDIVFPTPEASESRLSNSGDTSRSNAPFAMPASPNIADNSESYTSSGGSFGDSDDLDDPFKRRPGGGMAPLYSFEVMSKLVSRIILVPALGANEGTVKKKQVWDTQIVLKIKRGWNEQTILISQQLWDKIRRANLERNAGLFLAMSRSPDNLEAAFEHYLNSNPEPTEDYRGYTKQAFILSPKQLLSVSVFPGSCPTGVSCPKGEGTEKNTKSVSGPGSSEPPSYAKSQAAYYQATYSGSGNGNGNGNGGDDGFGWTPNSGVCQKCKQIKSIYRNDMCFECVNNGTVVFEQSLNDPPPVVTTEKIPVPLVDTSAIRLSQWLNDLVRKGEDTIFFHNVLHYKSHELYKVFTETLFFHKEALNTFHKYWVKLFRNELSTGELILQVGELASHHDVDKHTEIARIVKTLASHWIDILTESSLFTIKENKLADILKERNLVTSNELYNLECPVIDEQTKKELMNFIYHIFQQTSNLLTHEIVPSTRDTLFRLNELSRELNKDYIFGCPVYEDGQIDILRWGFARHTFTTTSNRHLIERNTQFQTLERLGHYISGCNSSTPEQVRAIFTALAILSPVLPETHSFIQKLSDEQRELFSHFSETARKGLVTFLDSITSDQKNAFITNMFFVFGVVPKELADQLTKE
ncbi:hypothetical protein [Endozoicomonas sp. 4G]|uniref:hypothetical protein n=1 Tax=Endozoicomonas sp. 4G TaxID=2872754 RepID=UPI0020791ECC|nr:hypothetical protein [Endozoicomonas sp. 4G]